MKTIDTLDAELLLLWIKLVNIHADSSVPIQRQAPRDDKHEWLVRVNGLRCQLREDGVNLKIVKWKVTELKHKLASLSGCGS